MEQKLQDSLSLAEKYRVDLEKLGDEYINVHNFIYDKRFSSRTEIKEHLEVIKSQVAKTEDI